MKSLEERFAQLSEVVKEYLCDKRLFPYMDCLGKSAEKQSNFEKHKLEIKNKFGTRSKEYRSALAYLIKIYQIEEEKVK